MVTDEERKKALADARDTVTARLKDMQSDMSENEEALFLVIEQELNLNREQCMKRLRMHKEEEFARMVDEEYKRNLDALEKRLKWTVESFKAFEKAMIPVDATNEQTILGWEFRFKDEMTGVESPTIREIFRFICTGLPDPLVLTYPKRFVQEVSSKYDRKIFEQEFDRKDLGWEEGKDDSARYYRVKFMLRQRA